MIQNKNSLGFHAVILAAGQSSRMNRQKAALPWIGGKALLPWMVDALTDGGWETTAVVSPETFVHWEATLPAGCAVLNPEPARGKISSLVCGVEKLPQEAKWILISAVDQPRLPMLYHRLRREADAESAKIIVPANESSRGHPVVLGGELRDELLAIDEGSLGLRALLDAHRLETYRLPDSDPAECQWDLNTPAVYEEALAFFRKNCLSTLNDQPSTVASA
jgi:molybdenum cofactor cytidylyltransferase